MSSVDRPEETGANTLFKSYCLEYLQRTQVSGTGQGGGRDRGGENFPIGHRDPSITNLANPPQPPTPNLNLLITLS